MDSFFCFYKVSGLFFDFLNFLDSEFSKFSGLYFFLGVYVFFWILNVLLFNI